MNRKTVVNLAVLGYALAAPSQLQASELDNVVAQVAQGTAWGQRDGAHLRDFPLPSGEGGVMASYNPRTGQLLLYARGGDSSQVHHFKPSADGSFQPVTRSESASPKELIQARGVYQTLLSIIGIGGERSPDRGYLTQAETSP